MAALTPYSNLNIAEVNKRAGFDDIASVLGEVAQVNDFVAQVPWYPSTHGMYNKQLQAKALGTGTWGKVNGPLVSIASETDVIEVPIKMYEGDSVVDVRLLQGADDPYAARDSEDALNMEGLMQGFVNDLFYVNSLTYPDAPKSLSDRRKTLNSDFTIGAGGSGGDTTSVWTFEFGPSGFYMVYNKNGAPGIQNMDMGKELRTVPTGTGQMRAWVRHYEIWSNAVLRNNRAMIRYANIETTGSSNIFDPDTYIKKVVAQLPHMGRNAVAFGNRTIVGQLTGLAYAKANAAYSLRDIVGFGPVTYIANVPLQMIEALSDAETVVS